LPGWTRSLDSFERILLIAKTVHLGAQILDCAERVFMLSVRRQAAQNVANKLIAAENAIDLALQRTAELAGIMPQARHQANYAAEIGQEALERAVGTISVLVQARREIVATHKELADTRTRVGLDAFAMGGLMDKAPTGATQPNIRAVA
jgi:negative regulator of replication initiation